MFGPGAALLAGLLLFAGTAAAAEWERVSDKDGLLGHYGARDHLTLESAFKDRHDAIGPWRKSRNREVSATAEHLARRRWPDDSIYLR